MILKLIKSFSSIESEWNRLYKQTPQVSPFLHPSAFKIALKYWYPYYLSQLCYPVFAVFYDSNRIQMIIPLVKSKNGYKLFGDANGFNECGILYEMDEIIPECLALFKKQYGDIEFIQINERSAISTFKSSCYTEEKNVSIEFSCGYEIWFKRLSSSVRQNIRTAYNRLERDAKSINFQSFIGGDIPTHEIIDLYCKRHENRYGVKTSRLKKWFLIHQSFATKFYTEAENSITFYLTIDGKPAAFLSGLFSGDRLIVPRLSINNEFRHYSPGMLLVAESIKFMSHQTEICILDLSKGEEDYKFKLGGHSHSSFRFKY